MPITNDVETNKITKEKDSSMNYRERRHDDWNTNYTLDRDKILTNRLTQRQSVNIPLMKYALQSVLKDIDEPPMIFFENLDNDMQREIYYNEAWNDVTIKNKLVIRDRIDKKQGVLYGRSFKKLNIVDGAFKFEIVDPQDMLVERHVDPADIDSARTLIQINIFRTLKSILENEDYNAAGKALLAEHYSKDSTSQEQEDNYNSFVDKQKRMVDLGLIDAYDPLVGETYIELNEVYMKEYDPQLGEDIIQEYVVASTDSGLIKLYKKPLFEVIGETIDEFWHNHHAYTSWAADPERTDFWSDAPADSIRQANLVLNSWISQLVENRTLRNFNMHYYDSTNIQFIPQTFSPVAWGWYPTPGNPNDLIKDVIVGDLSESLDEMQFIIGIAEKAVAVSGSQTGQVEQRQVTLGEVQIAVANAQERTKSIATFCQEDWKEFGLKYSKMLEAAQDKLDNITVYKKGRSGRRLYKKELAPKQYMGRSGYRTVVRMKSDKVNEDTQLLERLAGVISLMPENQPLKEIQKKHAMEFAGMSSDEMKEVLDFEKSKLVTPAVIPNVEKVGTTPPAVSNVPAATVAAPATVPTQMGGANA